jgi:hypothetical protein
MNSRTVSTTGVSRHEKLEAVMEKMTSETISDY